MRYFILEKSCVSEDLCSIPTHPLSCIFPQYEYRIIVLKQWIYIIPTVYLLLPLDCLFTEGDYSLSHYLLAPNKRLINFINS